MKEESYMPEPGEQESYGGFKEKDVGEECEFESGRGDENFGLVTVWMKSSGGRFE